MPIKSVKMKISKNKKMRFFLMSQGSFNPKIRFLGQKVCPVARVQTDRRTHTKATTVGTFQGFMILSINLSSRIGPKRPIKSVKIKILKNKEMCFFLMSQGSLNPKIRLLGQKVCPVDRAQTDRRTGTKEKTENTLSGFQ